MIFIFEGEILQVFFILLLRYLLFKILPDHTYNLSPIPLTPRETFKKRVKIGALNIHILIILI